MKRILYFVAISVLALASCSKVAPEKTVEVETQHAIAFNAVNQVVSTKADYDKSNSFGTYAWSKALTRGDYFMENEKISYDAVDKKWLPANVFYWPKEAALDFVSYSPYSATPWVAVTENKLTGSASGELQDYLYADKATGCTYDNSKDGVPTIFHHALSQVSFKIKALFTTYGKAGDETSWKITLTGATLTDVYGAGSLELSLSSDKKTWTLPNPAVWTVSGTKSDRTLVSSSTEVTTTGIDAATFYVVPQSVGSMKLILNYDIVTELVNGNQITEHISKTVNMSDFKYNSSSIDSWKINDNITYNISIKPTADSGTTPGGSGTPEDVVIKFNPSVSGWNNIDVSASIQI